MENPPYLIVTHLLNKYWLPPLSESKTVSSQEREAMSLALQNLKSSKKWNKFLKHNKKLL